MLFEMVERMKFGNPNKGFNIPIFYSELKINTIENSGFSVKKQV